MYRSIKNCYHCKCKEYITVTEAPKRTGVSRVNMSKAVNSGKYALKL